MPIRQPAVFWVNFYWLYWTLLSSYWRH